MIINLCIASCSVCQMQCLLYIHLGVAGHYFTSKNPSGNSEMCPISVTIPAYLLPVVHGYYSSL